MGQEIQGIPGAESLEQAQNWDNACQDMGGYADCCGASETAPTCEYQPPSPQLVQKYARKAQSGE